MGQVITPEERAYAAGLFDGEGCVQLYMRERGGRAFRTSLSISGTDERPLKWLHERYGGHLGVDNRVTSSMRAVFNWNVMSLEAETFAKDIQPYLLVKQEQIDIWLYARTLVMKRGTHGKDQPVLTDEQIDERHALVARCKELKRIG